VHGIVTNHEGAIRVYSEPGRGTAFTLFFPAATSGLASPAVPPQEVYRGRSEHIMYVDDEEGLVLLGTHTPWNAAAIA